MDSTVKGRWRLPVIIAVSGGVIGAILVVLGIRSLTASFPPVGSRVEVGGTKRIELAAAGDYVVYGVSRRAFGADRGRAKRGMGVDPAWEGVSQSIQLKSVDDGKPIATAGSSGQFTRGNQNLTATSLGTFRMDRAGEIEIVTPPAPGLPQGSYLIVGLDREEQSLLAWGFVMCGGLLFWGSIVGAAIVAFVRYRRGVRAA